MKLIYFRVRVFSPHLILSDFLFGRILFYFIFLFRFGTKLKSTNFLFKPTAKFNGNQDTSCNMSYSLLAINQWQRKRARTQVEVSALSSTVLHNVTDCSLILLLNRIKQKFVTSETSKDHHFLLLSASSSTIVFVAEATFLQSGSTRMYFAHFF